MTCGTEMADVHDKLIGNWTDAAKVCRDEERGAGGGSWTARWSVGGGVRAAGSVTLQSPPGSAVLYSNLEGINCRAYTFRDLALPLGSILLSSGCHDPLLARGAQPARTRTCCVCSPLVSL